MDQPETAAPSPITNSFRTQLIQLTAAVWGCIPCKKEGFIFDPAKVKALAEKRECWMECPHCRSALHLTLPMIELPTTQIPNPGQLMGLNQLHHGVK